MDNTLLRRINQRQEAPVGTLTRGLIYSDDEIIHDLLFFYRDAGLITFGGEEINDRTVIRVRRGRRGTSKRAPHRHTRQSANDKPRLS
jgi:hypothetical protein